MKVVVTPRAEKEFLKIPKIERKKIQKKLLSLELNPFIGKSLGGEFKDQYSLRAWPYRIIYWINGKTKILYVTSIIHRQGAYN